MAKEIWPGYSSKYCSNLRYQTNRPFTNINIFMMIRSCYLCMLLIWNCFKSKGPHFFHTKKGDLSSTSFLSLLTFSIKIARGTLHPPIMPHFLQQMFPHFCRDIANKRVFFTTIFPLVDLYGNYDPVLFITNVHN